MCGLRWFGPMRQSSRVSLGGRQPVSYLVDNTCWFYSFGVFYYYYSGVTHYALRILRMMNLVVCFAVVGGGEWGFWIVMWWMVWLLESGVSKRLFPWREQHASLL